MRDEWICHNTIYRNMWIAVPPVGLYPPPLFLRTFYVHMFRHVGKMMNIWGVQAYRGYSYPQITVIHSGFYMRLLGSIYPLTWNSFILNPLTIFIKASGDNTHKNRT